MPRFRDESRRTAVPAPAPKMNPHFLHMTPQNSPGATNKENSFSHCLCGLM